MNQLNERYSLGELIGSGRAGEVYMATDTVLSRSVTIRRFPQHTLNLESLSEQWRKDYMTLISGLSRVSHPNIIRVIDGGIDEEGPYIVTTHIEGEKLKELAYGDKKFDLADAYDLISQVLDALSIAKEEGFFHLAMSPNSIIADKKPTSGYNYMLVDLGHSKLLPLIHGSLKAATMTQHPVFIAPELYEGESGSEQTSQFILGQLVYWLLAGGHPYAELSADEAYLKHKEGSLEPLSNHRKDIDNGLLKWLEVVLQPDPSNRFPNLLDALAALPEPPKRLYYHKEVLPPKPISENDLADK